MITFNNGKEQIYLMELFFIAMLSAFVMTIICGKIFIPMLRKLKFGQQVRDDGPQAHLKKSGTPTMGGIIFIIPIAILAFVFSKGSVDFTLVSVIITIGYALIGFIDDYIKVVKKRSLGLKAYQKIIGQLGLAIIFAIFAYNNNFIGSSVYIPFTNRSVDLGIWYIPLIVVALIAIVNSTNLTDGIDGLLSSVSSVCVSGIAAILFLLIFTGFYEDTAYVLTNAKNIFTFCGIVIGGCMGFLMFNSNPAKVFMGDCGSMGLGGAIGVVCILMKMPFLLIIIGGIYLLESLSDIIQVASYKTRKKRVFKMAPIHHHFELCGMSETQVVTMFTVVECLFALLALISILPLLK